ncbi:hypothetical protein DTX80_12160 [Bacilli bacterium]|nr:hypothetical protein WH51_02395 [Bacilli bacterium VT-13-104]PZD83552.1 hypothetical protein DEJ64_14520 [Bacilli bacterium]PZD85196.1 hypothetical protein DEJ60_13010 [Bacilli bacterium]PZD87917.1 hypothetical protein DEJ66_13525 [Bacilli bacterium]RCO05318.1 hypothetical protein DTX80_12160 [Bacilli bacterium]
MPFSISFQYSYVPKSCHYWVYPISNSIINQYSFNTFLFSLDLFFPLFFFIPFPKLYSNFEKTMKKQPKKAGKTVIFEPRKCENRGSVAKLYYDSNGGMRVGGVGF